MEIWVLIIQIIMQGQPFQINVTFDGPGAYNLTACQYLAFKARRGFNRQDTEIIYIGCQQGGLVVKRGD